MNDDRKITRFNLPTGCEKKSVKGKEKEVSNHELRVL